MNMATVKAFIRTNKKNTEVNVRFRLSDGRNKQLFHVSEIMVDPVLWDAKNDKYKSKSLIPNKNRIEFDSSISSRKKVLLEVYSNNDISNSKEFEEYIYKYLHPEKQNNNNLVITRINKYIKEGFEQGLFGESAKKQYATISRELERFFIIKGYNDCTIREFDKEKIIEFREFLKTEYRFIKDYPDLYTGVNKNSIPTKSRSKNTIAVKLKKLQSFFIELESNDEIVISPFRKLGKRKAVMMREQYDTPVYLEKPEFLNILNSDVPDTLIQTRDAFVLQCSLGCRIENFIELSYDNLSVREGIPYMHYLPNKTVDHGSIRKEISTPLMLFSLEIIKKYDFNFPILKYVSGEKGYNKKIKKLLEYLGIDRLVGVYNEELSELEYIPLYKVASSKLARKTHVDLMNKVQIDKYAAGLHSKKSEAVNRYTDLSLKDRFILMCLAFDSPLYKVDEKMNVIIENSPL